MLAGHWRRRRWAGSGQLFGARLLISYGLALATVGVVGYLTIDHDLRRSQVDTYAAAQRAHVRSFRSIARLLPRPATAISRIDVVMDAIARRPGTLEMNLIDQRHVIVASGFPSRVGRADSDPRIRDALALGRAYAGQEGAPRRDRSNFEFDSAGGLPSAGPVTVTASATADSARGSDGYRYQTSTDGGVTWSALRTGDTALIKTSGTTLVRFEGVDLYGNTTNWVSDSVTIS